MTTTITTSPAPKQPSVTKLDEAVKGLSEDQLQAKCYQWFHNTYPQYRGMLFHVPNGASRNIIEASKLKAMGVVPGIPDMILCINSKTTFFELKAENGRLSPAQIEIHKMLRLEGFDVHTVFSYDEFVRTIESLISFHDFKHRGL